MKALSIRQTAILLTLFCILLMLPFIGIYDFHTKGEPREAIVALSMLHSGNWILPVNNGVDIAFKPPFFHWCIAAFSWLFGGVSEFSSRLPSCLSLIIVVVYTFYFFGKRFNQRVGLLTAFITLTNFELHRAAFNCRVDMLLTATTVCAFYLLYQWYERQLKGFPWLAILCMSLATLTKGPVGIIVPCFAAGVFFLLRRETLWRLLLKFIPIVIASLVLPACWYYAAYQQGGPHFLDLMWEENVGRMTGTMTYTAHAQPWPYNFLTIIAGFAPWTLLPLFALCVQRYARPQWASVTWLKRFWNFLSQGNSCTVFVFVTICTTLFFFAIPQSKRSTYLMPVYPLLAYFLASLLVHLSHVKPQVLRWYGHLLASIGVLALLVMLLLKCGVVPDTLFHGRHAPENIAMMHALRNMSAPIQWVFVILPTIVALFWWGRFRKTTGMVLLGSMMLLMTCTQLVQDGALQPIVLGQKSDKAMASQIGRLVPRGKIYSYLDPEHQVASNKMRFFAIGFYLGDRLTEFDPKAHKGFLLIGKDDAAKNLSKLASDNDYRFELLYEGTKRTCDTRQIPLLYFFTRK